jgi:hypothetical protein
VNIAKTAVAGAVAGAIASIAVLILMAPLLLPRLTAVSLGDGTARVNSVIEVTGLDVELPHVLEIGDTVLFEATWTLSPGFMLSLIAAIGFGLAGALTVGLTRWIPRTLDDRTETAGRVRMLYASGIGTGVITGILAAQFAVTWAGDSGGVGTQITVFRFLIIMLVAGAVLGSSCAASTHLLERPDVIGMRGHTWETREQLVQSTTRALAVPVLALAGIATVVVSMGLLLIASYDEISHSAPLFLAGGAASAVLGLAAFAAYRR